MAVTDTAITLAAVMLWEAPDGDVLLSDGGIVKLDPGSGEQTFDVFDPVFGTIAAFESFETGVGDLVDGGSLSFQPAFSAALADWWRTDLDNTRVRIWLGEIDSDGVSMTGEELIADWLVDVAARQQGAEGEDLLEIDFMARQRKLFETQQGNVCSDTFHQTIWSGERGFENCHDGPQYFAWGAESPKTGAGGSASGSVGAGLGNGAFNNFGNFSLL